VSVKDRWVGPHEQVLNVPIECRWYGSDKPSSLLSTDVWLSSLLYWLAWERNWVHRPMDQLTDVLWIVSEAIFLRSSNFIQLYQWLVKGCHIRGPPVESVRRAYMDWHRKCTCVVGQVFPCMMYIDSNQRDSRIWVSLVCGSHHIYNLMSLIITDVVLLNILNYLQLLYD
jgi:hypothetical protein